MADARSGSVPQRLGLGSASIQSQRETALMVAVKKQMQALEERLASQISRQQHGSERFSAAAIERLEGKISGVEAFYPKLERRVAELGGSFKGLSDEMQSQIRRVDQVETRLWESRSQLEEEIRSKCSEMEQLRMEASASARTSHTQGDEAVRRMEARARRFEGALDQMVGKEEILSSNISMLDARMQDVEALHLEGLALGALQTEHHQAPPAKEEAQADISVKALERVVGESEQRIEQVLLDFQDLQARVEAQEERVRTLRTMQDNQVELVRSMKFDRQDGAAVAKELQTIVRDLDKARAEMSDRIGNCEKLLRSEPHKPEEHGFMTCPMRDDMPVSPNYQWEPRTSERAFAYGQPVVCDTATGCQAARECSRRLDVVEDLVESVTEELASIRPTADFAPRITGLVNTLSEVAPKLMDQEQSVHDLLQKVGSLEARQAVLSDSGPSRDGLAARLNFAEAQIERLAEAVSRCAMRE